MLPWRKFNLIFMVLTSFTLLSCDKLRTPASPIVARVGESDITVADLTDAFKGAHPFYQTRYLGPSGPKILLDSTIRDEVLVQEAKLRGIDKDPVTLLRQKQAQRQVLVEMMRERLQTMTEAETRKAVSDYYSQHIADYSPRDTLTVSRMVMRTAADARKALQLLRTQSFAKVAQKLSIDKTSTAASPFVAGTLPPDVEKQIASLKPGGISKVIKIDEGYAIFRLEQRTQYPVHKLEAVAPSIKNTLINKTVNNWVDKKLTETRPQVDEKLLYTIQFWPPESQAH